MEYLIIVPYSESYFLQILLDYRQDMPLWGRSSPMHTECINAYLHVFAGPGNIFYMYMYFFAASPLLDLLFSACYTETGRNKDFCCCNAISIKEQIL